METSEKRSRHIIFWRKYFRLTRGRVPALRALDVIGSEEANPEFREVIRSLRVAVEQGVLMSEAMHSHKAEFSASVIELIRMAEKTGAWDEILGEVVDGLAEGTFE